jgi:DNA polymerase II large subunit
VIGALNKKFPIMDKIGTVIGARMGRPEKAKMRKLTGSPHVLFPVGEEGGRLRSFQTAMEKGTIKNNFPIYEDEKGEETIYRVLEGKKNKKKYFTRFGQETKEKDSEQVREYKSIDLDIVKYYNDAIKLSGVNRSMLPELVKGVRGTSNKNHVPENLTKGILRSKHKIYVNKDGTTRYDMTEMPITHFKSKEIGTSIEKLKKLGYTHDAKGGELVNEE